jgi:hypothetical protein
MRPQKTEGLNRALHAPGGNVGFVVGPCRENFSCSGKLNHEYYCIRRKFFDTMLQLDGMDMDLCDRLDHVVHVLCEAREGPLVLFELLERE